MWFECDWSESCCVVTYHCSLGKAFNVVDILLCPMSTTGHAMVGPGGRVSKEILRNMEKAVLRLVFSNTVFHKRAILLSC